MNAKERDTKTHAEAVRNGHDTAGERDAARARHRDRKWRIGAAQVAAPSTRRWRRAGKFGAK